MRNILICTAFLAALAVPALAQKGVDKQTQKIKDDTAPSKTLQRENDATRSFDWGKGKTKVRDPLPNPYRVSARRDALIEFVGCRDAAHRREIQLFDQFAVGGSRDEDVRRVADERRGAADVRGEDLDEHERDRVDVERVGEQERDRDDQQDRRDVVQERRQHRRGDRQREHHGQRPPLGELAGANRDIVRLDGTRRHI